LLGVRQKNLKVPFELRLPSDKPKDESILSPQILSHLKESIKKNKRLGELLAQ